jgi:hypothetical protein
VRRRSLLRFVALFAAALAAPATHVVLLPEAAAGDGKKGESPKKDEAQIKREAELTALAKHFDKRDVESLLARVAKDQKVTLNLDGKEGDYSVTQARGVLAAWFKGVEKLSVETKTGEKSKVKFESNVGYFPMTTTKKGADKSKDGTLGVTLGDLAADGAYTLRKLRVDEK